MLNPNIATHAVTVFTDPVRWEGLLDIPAHRRLSDHMADRDLQYLVLRRVQYAQWQNQSYETIEERDSIVLVKQNIAAIAAGAASSSPSQDRLIERVPKVPTPLVIHIPPLLLAGDFHTPEIIDWFAALRAARADFIPLTNVTLWHYQTHTLLEQNLALVLVQVNRIIGVEPKPASVP
jgi:hypothetical protein